ncbi:MAG: DsbC family protein, partial [Oleibacter sp.]|nr:DsbC family protein [Thalassolituus sp.]
DTRMNANRAQAMASIKDSDTVFYPAKGTEKARINVFTDIDCGYCQKLHQEVPKLTVMGIAVRYLAYPRSGIKDEGGQDFTESYRKLNYVWCQKDREKAMTDMKTQQQMISMMYGQARSKTGSEQIASIERMQAVQNDMNKKVDSDQCDSPVANQFLLGSTLGVSGTPALITEEGELIPGYLPAAELAKRLGVM